MVRAEHARLPDFLIRSADAGRLGNSLRRGVADAEVHRQFDGAPGRACALDAALGDGGRARSGAPARRRAQGLAAGDILARSKLEYDPIQSGVYGVLGRRLPELENP